MYHIDFERPCHVHFIGIGGISMSGLAEILLEEGFTVSGSDARSRSSQRSWRPTEQSSFTDRKRRILWKGPT